MPSDCLLPPYGFDTSSTDLTAVVGSNSTYDSFIPITSLTYIVVGITATTTTARNPLATSCEESRTMTKNGFRVKTRSADGYQFEILIENICTNLNSCGLTCGDCVPTTTLSSKMDTSDISTNAKNTFKTVSIPRLTSTELSDETTTTYTTNQASSEVTGSSSPKATSEESSTIFSNVTNNSVSLYTMACSCVNQTMCFSVD
ncbi:unnamed protein product [Mytilus coruscus]|uniref:Uncharacterized protein n=1 Tax=Mytilus coruscus TaxID=42192 RepID=A0A6J8A4G2_MYTCO|nr:unnamed protein product [Mytilus coruscus]